MSERLKAGRYEIESEVGRGGMGIVYRARDVRLGRTVALKMLPAELVNDPERRRRLAQEARAASSISHPSLATVYDFEEVGDEVFVVYEYIEGATLREALHPPSWTIEAILRVGIQLADGLAAAHERGVVHRDLKPENIMLKKDSGLVGHFKILDFGLAKFRRPLGSAVRLGETGVETAAISTSAGLLVGTVNYMSPEQLEGEPADFRTDIYSLGLILYEMATGANPFIGKTASSTIANILKQDAPRLEIRRSFVPPEFDRIVRKCLRKRREERYQTARELEVDLSNLLQDSSNTAKPLAAAQAQPAFAPPGIVPARAARLLFTAIQAGYLLMYGLALYKWDSVMARCKELVPGSPGETLGLLILFSALVGTPVRVYLFSALVVDYSDTGLKFRKLFPWALFLDLAWALSPLLLYSDLKGLTLAFAALLAYVPFAGRRLLYEIYAPSGGRARCAHQTM
ncbi:MAG: serine/threonine-protein kinase [Deltaproteobacteria bacterium]